MKVLITGVAGFVGSHCAEYYALKGAEVYGIDNLIRSQLFKSRKKSVEYNWEYLVRYKNIHRIKADLRYPETFSRLRKQKFDLVIHTAAQPGVGFSLKNPQEDFSLNALATFN
ncbi:MAG TPA: NAD-dependent epimerase/dehydratase family protein, partial [Candidatus Omnitrophica bacterium]|nr:NAD-dependent epimerase/dehydratase family protein [Candidatus Omnitrophota bacterium]